MTAKENNKNAKDKAWLMILLYRKFARARATDRPKETQVFAIVPPQDENDKLHKGGK